MFPKLHTLITCLSISLISLFGQDADTTMTEEEVGGREMYTSVDIAYTQDQGNTDFLSLYGGFDFSLMGDLGPISDTEFLISYYRTDDRLDGDPFTDDASLLLMFDMWANQRVSPFLFAQSTFDKTVGLNQRFNYGIGAKAKLLKGFSLSYAFLAESEDYEKYDFFQYNDSIGVEYYSYTDSMFIGEYNYDSAVVTPEEYYYYDMFYETWDAAYWDGTFDENGDSVFVFYDYDSTLVDGYWGYMGDSTLIGEYFYYTDSTEKKSGGKEKFFRHSIRPKFKVKLFDENLVFDYRFYFKPKVGDWEDYLLEHELKISIATFYELLTIDLNYTDKYNSRFDVNNGGQDIINPLTLTPYKERDKSLILGLSFSF